MELALGLAVVWIVIALGLGYLMGRRGFEAYSWTAIGLFLGPLAVALAAVFLINPPSREPEVLRTGRVGTGTVDVLVGIDGSPESEAAMRRVGHLFGGTAGRITLAHVLPLDATRVDDASGAARLEAACEAHSELGASAVVLRGEPVVALRDHVREHSYDVLVIGTRGAGRSKAHLGGVATTLARGVGIPVLLVDDDDDPPASREPATMRATGRQG